METLVRELGAFGVVAAVLLLVIRWMLQQFTDQMKAQTIVLLGIEKAQYVLINLLIRHDAQVRGINPGLPHEQDERSREAISIYREISMQLKGLESHVEEQAALVRKAS